MIEAVLKGKKALIVRPEASSDELSLCLRAVGCELSLLPAITIKQAPIAQASKELILNLDQYSAVIVTSQHAAKFGIELIQEYWPQYPVQQTWLAIGQKTADILLQEHVPLVKPDTDLTSEMLLQLPELKLAQGSKVLLMKGAGGRTTIKEELESSGLVVDCLDLYTRERPSYTSDEIDEKLHRFKPEFIIALSAESVANLKAIVEPNLAPLQQANWIVPSERVAKFAQEQGFKLTYVPDNLRPINIVRVMATIHNK